MSMYRLKFYVFAVLLILEMYHWISVSWGYFFTRYVGWKGNYNLWREIALTEVFKRITENSRNLSRWVKFKFQTCNSTQRRHQNWSGPFLRIPSFRRLESEFLSRKKPLIITFSCLHALQEAILDKFSRLNFWWNYMFSDSLSPRKLLQCNGIITYMIKKK